MAVYDVTLTKEFTAVDGIPPWSNVYHVNAASEEAALDIGEDIAALEMTVSFDVILAVKLSARQQSALAGSGRQRAISVQGSKDSAGENFLPLFNTVRVTFTDGVARPDQKYLRLPVAETDQNGGALSGGTIDFIEANYSVPLMALDGVVSSQGVPYTSQIVQPNVQMRQRNWSRRARPGFHRGYVPD